MTLEELGEDGVVERLLRQLPAAEGLIVGPGDDCAVVATGDASRYGLLKTDCIVEGVHFLPDSSPEDVGWKVMARNVSDFAAMGAARPRHALVTLVVPGTREISWAEGVYAGIARCAERFGIAVVGGETSKVSDQGGLLSVSLMGEIAPEHLVLRSGAREGDAIFVTGRLGGSLGGKHLTFVPRLAEAVWLAERYKPSSMMDLSDGLAKDLPRLALASSVGYQVDLDAVPCSLGCSTQQAMGDGEDYELVFTIAEETASALQEAWQVEFPDLPLTRIGGIVAPEDSLPLSGGWDHFAASTP